MELALGRFPFADTEEEDDIPEELKGTLSPTKPDRDAASKKEHSRNNGSQGGGLSMFDLLQRIVNEPALSLPRDEGKFPKSLCDFVDLCLIKDFSARPSPKELESHDDFKTLEDQKVDLLAWVKGLKV